MKRLVGMAILLLVMLLLACAESSMEPERQTTPNPMYDIRDGRFMGLFNSILYNNGACRAMNGDVGSCVTYPECFAMRGTASGLCANGLGLCCVLHKTCQGAIYANNTHFVNPGHPSAYSTAGQCTVSVTRLLPEICQIRLDFETFSIAQPDVTDHRCITDSFVVSGASSPVPVICGDNAGQHMYIHLDTSKNFTSPIMMTMVTSNMLSLLPITRNWKIRVSQIVCRGINSGYEAPPGCLQYFIGTAGILKSFNFFFDAGSTTSARQLSNQDYTICIRQESGQCGIQYNACADPVNNPGHAFTLTGTYTSTNAPTVSLTDVGCANDYLMIPCGSDMSQGRYINSDYSTCATRMCGGVFNSINAQILPRSVYSFSVPFELRFHTDDNEARSGDQGNLGFCLTYQQRPCAPTNPMSLIFSPVL